MIRIILMLALVLLTACSGTPAKRDTAYWAAATATVADGYSTDYAFKNNPCAYEGGFVASRMIGKRPSTAKIAAYTGARLGLLEATRYFKPILHKSYKYWTIGLTLYVVPNNMKIGDQECN